MFSQNTVELFT